MTYRSLFLRTYKDCRFLVKNLLNLKTGNNNLKGSKRELDITLRFKFPAVQSEILASLFEYAQSRSLSFIAAQSIFIELTGAQQISNQVMAMQ